ncbi:MAG: hypothetical protein IKB16_06505 [Lentisphaeria bacterium]|jgi:uncharacterized protein with PIN domain|nr:hypothetical protein [Lentisphaeria bacterium]
MDQQKQNIQYLFATVENFNKAFNDRFLICPQCNERLKQMDIENYSRCPYCNYRFTDSASLEDFMLEPVVENWIRQQGAAPYAANDAPEETRIP